MGNDPLTWQQMSLKIFQQVEHEAQSYEVRWLELGKPEIIAGDKTQGPICVIISLNSVKGTTLKLHFWLCL